MSADAAVVLGAYLDDVVAGVPAQAAARVPALATYQFLHEVVRHRVSQHGVIVLRVDRQCLNE
jgi:hypothetical protein